MSHSSVSEGKHSDNSTTTANQPPDASPQSPSTVSAPTREGSFLKPRRPPLPNIDSQAGRPLMQFGELTPASSGHGSLEYSPRSASSGQRSPWRAPPRKTSAPSARRPPSPELTNLDCAFPPFPTTTVRSKTPVSDRKSRQSENGSVRSRAQGSTQHQSTLSTPRSLSSGDSVARRKRAGSMHSSRHRDPSAVKITASSQPSSASTSRRPSFSSLPATRKGSVDNAPPLPTSTTLEMVPRSKNIAVKPLSPTSAVDNQGRKDVPEVKAQTLHRSQSTEEAVVVKPETPTTLAAYAPLVEPPIVKSETTNKSTTLNSGPTTESEESSSTEPSYRTKRPPPINSGRTLPLLSRFKSILTPRRRAPTYPLPNDPSQSTGGDSLARRPSDTASITHSNRESMISPSPERIPLGQSPVALEQTQDTSNIVSPFESRQPDMPPDKVGISSQPEQPSPAAVKRRSNEMEMIDEMLSSVVTASAPSKPRTRSALRTSTDSASSYGSVTLSTKSMSSCSSLPPKEEKARTRSNTTRSSESVKMALPKLPSAALTSSSLESKHSIEPQENLIDNVEMTKPPIDVSSRAPSRLPALQPDSLPDPLCEESRLFPLPTFTPRPLTSEPQNPSQSIPRAGPSRRNTVGTNKGICRGCSITIETSQKSVSSADGRLTGRYHKECFVCRTCRSPFATADFYVHNDYPYCSQHYHELNGTVCGSCGNGIEGEYMETSTVAGKPSKKFHTSCLACATCHIPLREDYFELNGRVYCEKDAFRLASLSGRTQYDSIPSRPSPLVRELITSGGSDVAGLGLGVGGRFPERRLTKLIETTT